MPDNAGNNSGAEKNKASTPKPAAHIRFAQQVNRASAAMAIPGIMLAGPLVGLFLGKWIGGYFFDHPRRGMMLGLVLGIVAAARETVRVLKQTDKK